MNVIIIITLALLMIVIIWFIITSRISSIVGRTIDNLWRLAILMENEEHEAARIAVKMMQYQFKRLDKKHISYDEFILIAMKISPQYKVEKAIEYLDSAKNNSDLDFIFGNSDKIKAELHRSKINRALKTLNIAPIVEKNNEDYCVAVCIALVREIIKRDGLDLYKADEDDIFTGGTFAYTFSDYLTQIFDCNFELVSSAALLFLFTEKYEPDEMSDYVVSVANTFNYAIENTKVVQAIGQNISIWINNPTHEQFNHLVKLYGVCRQAIQTKS